MNISFNTLFYHVDCRNDDVDDNDFDYEDPAVDLLVMFTFALLDIPAAGSWGVWDNCLHLAAGSEQDQDDNQEIHISAFW